VSWLSRLVNIARGGRLDRDLDDEIRFHLEARTADLVKDGIPENEAAERARRQFGNTLFLRESSRNVKLMPRVESIVRDVVFGLRLSRRTKTVTGAALLSLSLAIGACTAAFSLIDALILRPLPVDDPHSLVYIGLRGPGDTRDGLSFNYPLFAQMRDISREQVRLFAVSDQRRGEAMFDDRAEPEKVYGQWISGDALAILGVEPALGRLLTTSDDVHPGQHPVAVLSYEFWTRRFGRDPRVLGRWVTIREKSLQIVGVAEQGFSGVEPGIMTDLWAPTMMWDDQAISDPSTRWFRIWGRLQSASGSEQGQARLQSVLTGFNRDLAASRPELSRERVERLLATKVFLRSAATGPSGLREQFARPLWVLGGVAVLVLLIACSNVASLLVARATAREREMALRISIGAGRGRLIQQLLIESALIAIASCALGAIIAYTAAPAVVSMLSTSRSLVRLDLQIDWRLFAFLGTVAATVTALFGLVPALRASAVAPVDALKSGSGKHTSAIAFFRPLVAGQTAFGFVVLFVAGLCLSSFARLEHIELGFDEHDLAIVHVDARPLGHGVEALAAWEALLDRLQHSPGIQGASLSGWSLFEGPGRNKSLRIPGRPIDPYEPWYLGVSPGFFNTMRIRHVAGRDFEWRDGRPAQPSAVIVNESFARRYYPSQSPIGQRFFRVDGGTVLVPQDIIGVVADAKYTDLREPAPPTVYDPYRPDERPAATVQVRTSLASAGLAAMLRQELPKVHPAFRLVDVTPQSRLVDNHLVRDRALALLSAFFSVVAIVLVSVGLFGVLSYSVVQRTREIGIRLALGARPRQLVRLVLADVGGVTAIGLIVGAAGGIAAARFVTSLLYEVSLSDASTFAAPLVCLVAACALSALIPALRAMRVDPNTALRYE
jgi:predicted permease